MEPVLLSEIHIYVELRKEGYSYRTIAEKMERDRTTIKRHVEGYAAHGDKWLTEMQRVKKGGKV